MTWQSVYIRPKGRGCVIIDYSTRDLAVRNTVDSLTWLAGHALKHDWLDHVCDPHDSGSHHSCNSEFASCRVASYLAAAEAFAATTEGAYGYTTHAGAKYLVMEGQ